MIDEVTLPLVDGVRVVAPRSMLLLTPYVLTEQQDWFEDEIRFLRLILQPGDRVIDVGANYGTYTLSMAKCVGPTGHVWAFEPASATAEYLARGVAANAFSHVTLERSALSREAGEAQLGLNENAELNALVRGGKATARYEAVPLTTLDLCMDRLGWNSIAFLKLDAEGEEVNILSGGHRFFAELSPLVQYEIKAADGVDRATLQAFAPLGYNSYRLVRGLNLLVPFDADKTVDGFLLNLFACKPDRARMLADRGWLLDAAIHMRTTGRTRSQAIAAHINDPRAPYGWRRAIGALPYGTLLTDLWGRRGSRKRAQLEESLAFYALSQDTARPAIERFDALEVSVTMLRGLCTRQPSLAHWASLARAANDFGERAVAVDALRQLAELLARSANADFSDPFVAPCARFDHVPPGPRMDQWLLAATIEAFELNGAYSSFYSGDTARARLESFQALCATNPSFASPQMARRLDLVRARTA